MAAARSTPLRLEQNGGYGMGNQEGINYAVSCLEADYVIIANPDIHVPPRCIRRVKDALDKTQGAVAASARVKDPMGGELFSYWTLLPLWKDLLDTGLGHAEYAFLQARICGG